MADNTSSDTLAKLVREHGIRSIDLRYMVTPRGWRSLTLPAEQWSEVCARGVDIELADAPPGRWRLVPDASTAVVDPFCQFATLAVVCDVRDRKDNGAFAGDPRAIARRVVQRLAKHKAVDEALVSTTLTFHVFDHVAFGQTLNGGHYHLESREGAWRRGKDTPDNLGSQVQPSEGEGRLMPADSLGNLRCEMAAALAAWGIPVCSHRHGPATGGQVAFELGAESLLTAADHLVAARYVLRNVAARHGKVATFMPQPLMGEPGCPLPIQMVLRKGGTDVLSGGDGLTEAGQHAVGGLLAHTPGLLGVTCCTTNSYRRINTLGAVRGGVGHDPADELAAIQTPTDEPAGVIFHAADALCSPHVAYAALVQALLAGIDERVDPGAAIRDAEVDAMVEYVPLSLEESLGALGEDFAYLTAGEVFDEYWVRAWIADRLRIEVLPLRQRPHPHEFCLHFSA